MLPERAFRAFGSVRSDIELDFMGTAKIQLSLDLLGRCAQDPGFLPWLLQHSGSERILALWRLVWSSGKPERVIEVPLVCQEPSCKEALALSFTEEELVDLVPKTDADPEALRVPTSQDALELLHQDPGQWLGRITAGDSLAVAEARWQKADPLLSLTCETQCPACGRSQSFSLDLEGMALKVLRGLQMTLIHTVHLLAERYHWSEEEILALPAWRRNHYLRLLKRDGAWT